MAVPSVVLPSLNSTVPVGMAPVDDTTVAVNVTAAANVDGFRLDVNAVVVVPVATVCVMAADVLAVYVASPL